MPPCRSPTVFILLRSTPMVTSVWAISGDRPVTITLAPWSRDASTVRTRWFATLESMAGTPVMSMTTSLARLARMARRSCSVSWRARWASMMPMIGRISSRSRTGSTGVDSSRMASCCWRMIRSRSWTKPTATVLAMRLAAGLIGVLDAIELREVCPILGEQRARELVAQQQHDPHDLVRFHPPRNDALGQIAGISFQRLDRPGLKGLQVVVVDGRGFRENLIRRHGGQQLGFGDAPRPLLAQLGTILS